MLQIEYLSEYSSVYTDIYVSKALINIKDIIYITATTIGNTSHVVIGIGGREFILTSSSASKIFEAMDITKDDVFYYGRYSYIHQ